MSDGITNERKTEVMVALPLDIAQRFWNRMSTFEDNEAIRAALAAASTGPMPKADTVEVSFLPLKNLLRCFEDLARPDKPLGYDELKRAVEAKEAGKKC